VQSEVLYRSSTRILNIPLQAHSIWSGYLLRGRGEIDCRLLKTFDPAMQKPSILFPMKKDARRGSSYCTVLTLIRHLWP
jgi:hypothetical protein